MENSNKQSGLKDISNISRNLVSAFPQVNTAQAIKNSTISTNTNMKTTSSIIRDEQDKENADPRSAPVPVGGQASKVKETTSEISSSLKSSEQIRFPINDDMVSDAESDGFEVDDDFKLDEGSDGELDKTNPMEDGAKSSTSVFTSLGNSTANEAPSPLIMSSLINNRVLPNVAVCQDPKIIESIEDNGASPMFSEPQRPQIRKLDFTNMDTTSPVTASTSDQQKEARNLFRRSFSMVEKGQRSFQSLQLKTTSPEHMVSAQAAAADMTSPLSRPFASFKRPSVPLQPLSQNNQTSITEPCKKIRRGMSMKEPLKIDMSQTLPRAASTSNLDSPQIAKPMLQLSLSESEANIKKACSMADVPNLTGDRSRNLCLPTVTGVGRNAKNFNSNVDCHTLADLLHGKYEDQVASYRIIDARYCYEFKGGHIRGAENFGTWDEEAFFKEFLPTLEPKHSVPSTDEKAHIIIFHCEFSSERGPKLMALLRKRDRDLNQITFPALHYPECYLLSKGYKEFYEHYPELCEPKAYVQMADPKFANEERKFHRKSKTWGGPGGTISRTNSSSRLLKL